MRHFCGRHSRQRVGVFPGGTHGLATVATSQFRPREVYSNRFAAHILKQFPLRTLARSRGWQARLLGRWDGGGEAEIHRVLPNWNLTATLGINAIYHDDDEADDKRIKDPPIVSQIRSG